MIYLYLIGLWLLIASILDLKYREIPNWLSFSLAAFGLSYNGFKSVFSFSYWPFLFSLLGLALFVLLAYGLYYSRVFAGGDAKLLMGLGPSLPFLTNLEINLSIMIFYILLLLFVGGIYGLFYSLFIAFINRKRFWREFKVRVNNRVWIGVIVAVLLTIPVLLTGQLILLFFPLLAILLPFLLFYSKAIEECMVREKGGREVVVGDWLYRPVKVDGKEIKPSWEGLSEKEVKMLRSKKKVKIKDGIPFVPSFFIAFILLVWLRHSFWFINYFWLFRFLF